MGSLRCLMKNKCQNRVPGHPIYKVGHNLTGLNNILEGGIVPLINNHHITHKLQMDKGAYITCKHQMNMKNK